MSKQQRAVTMPYADPFRTQRAGLGLRVDLRAISPGVLELEALPEHRLVIHAGAPVRGTCRLYRLHYTRGDVDIFPAGTSEVWEADGASAALELALAPSLLWRAAEDMGIDPDRAGLEPRHQIRDPQIEYIAWALDAERRSDYPSGRLYVESLGLGLAVHLLGHYGTPLRVERGLSKPQLRRVTDYVEAHIGEDLSLARLAEVAGVSASHFKTLFKRSTGLAVHEYVIRRRVERAKEMLLRGELPASQVAFEAGFSHQSHMARWMRRVLGVTPSAVAAGSRVR